MTLAFTGLGGPENSKSVLGTFAGWALWPSLLFLDDKVLFQTQLNNILKKLQVAELASLTSLSCC